MRWAIVVLLLSLLTTSSAQVNYVRNPGFETYSKCPYTADQIKLATGWSSIDSISLSPDSIGKSGCNAGYCNECSSNLVTAVPSSIGYYQFCHTGLGMALVYMFIVEPNPILYPYYRDYIQGRLYKPLTKGKSYCVSFYVNLTESSGYAIKDIGAYFDNGSIDTSVTSCLPQTRYTPQVVNSGGIISDKVNWTKIEGSFVANGTESFITIGNFKDGPHTTSQQLTADSFVVANNGQTIAYYLIDDVSVIESDLPAFAGNDRHIGLGDSTYIGRPQEVGLECTWAKLGSSTVIGTGGGIWVKPTTTTSYVVTQTLCGAVKTDTVLVEVWPLGLTSVNGQTQGYSLVPNPNKGRFELVQSVPNDEALAVHVCDILGRIVYQGQAIFKNGKAVMELSWLPQGMYYLQLQNGQGLGCNLRLLKEE